MSYRKPLLAEILVEFHFEPGSFPFERLLPAVPKLVDIGFSSPEWDQGPRIKIVSEGPQEVELVPRVRCWSKDRLRIAQLSPDLAVVNQLGPYQGWESFKSAVLEVEGAVRGAAGSASHRFVALKTVDHLVVGANGFRVGRYFNCDGTLMPRSLDNVSVACDFTCGQGLVHVHGYNRATVFSVKAAPAHEGFQAQLLLTFQKKTQGDIGLLLNTLHDEAEAAFEAQITSETRSIMGG